jgi:uncharacterized membrane protein YdjX (TVP38/TMEM64 family)
MRFAKEIMTPRGLSRKQFIRRFIIFIIVTLIWIHQIYRVGKGTNKTYKIHSTLELPRIYIPHSIADVKTLSNAMKDYANTKPSEVLYLFILVFVFKQTYCIPGAALLNIIAGSLYGTCKGLFLVVFLTSIGSSLTYLLSKHLLGSLIFGRIISESKLFSLRTLVEANRSNLLFVIISLRMVPLVPGSITNFTAPFLKIPLTTYFIGTSIGIVPYAFLCVSAASTLASMNNVSDVLDFWIFSKLLFFVLMIGIPLYNQKRILRWLGIEDLDLKDKNLPL